MKVAVTGGAGFIGAATVAELQRQGHTPLVLDRHTTPPVDVTDPAALNRALNGCDAVIHLAGVLGTAELFDRLDDALAVNVVGFANVVRACEQVGAGLVAITIPNVWANVYQTGKRFQHDLALSWHRHRGLPVSFVRAFNVFGPGQKVHGVRKIIPTFARAAWQGKPVPVWGDGQQVVDLVHVADVARVLVAALAFGGGEVLDAGTGIPHTVNEVARMVWGRAQPDRPLLVEYAPMRAGEDDHTIVVAKGDGWDLPGVAGLRPEFRPEELAATVDWYRTERP